MVTRERVIWGAVILVLIPVALNPAAWIVGGVLAVVILATGYGLPFAGDLIRQRQSGVGSAKIRERARGDFRRDRE